MMNRTTWETLNRQLRLASQEYEILTEHYKAVHEQNHENIEGWTNFRHDYGKCKCVVCEFVCGDCRRIHDQPRIGGSKQ